MNARNILLGIASAALLAACSQAPVPAPAPETTEADEAAVRGMTDRFVAAWNAGDTRMLGAMIAPDAVEMPPGRPSNMGRDAVLAALGSGYDIAVMQQSATVDEVMVMGDYANAWGTWRLDAVAAADRQPEPTTGKWMALYHRDAAGAWQVLRWMWNRSSGPPLPAA